MATFNTNNVWVSPTGFLNTGSFAAIGGSDPSPGAGQRFPGLLGAWNVLSGAAALKVSKTTVGTLFAGTYQLVKYASAVTTVSRGQLLFWDTNANNGFPTYTVAASSTLTTPFRAGIALAAETAGGGNYVWIQTGGLASILFGASPANADGQIIVQATAADTPLLTATTVNTFADATTIVMTNSNYVKAKLGINYGAPTASVTNKVFMFPDAFIPNIG